MKARITSSGWHGKAAALGLAVATLAACGDNLKVPPTEPPAGSATPYTPRREIVSGAARIQGGGFKMDATVGHSFDQRGAEGGGKRLESAAAVKR